MKIRQLVEQNSFATVLSYPHREKPFINHLPVIWATQSVEDRILIGHMSKRNPQWQHFKQNSEGTIIVNGPHCYITPRWYVSGRDVPTWNYAVAHLHGKIELVENYVEQVEILKRLTAFFEGGSSNPWEFEMPDDLQDEVALTASIISFKFHIEKIEAKFKLSQNRSREDRQAVIAGLAQRNDNMSNAIRSLMVENESSKSK